MSNKADSKVGSMQNPDPSHRQSPPEHLLPPVKPTTAQAQKWNPGLTVMLPSESALLTAACSPIKAVKHPQLLLITQDTPWQDI